MEKLKTKTVIKMLQDDGWYLDRQKGSHRQYKHPIKKGTVTVNGKPNEVMSQFLLSSIFKQAQW
ncbi:MAG: type II toxin-antitoxin system HicA family toxin [Paludibacter sp.]|nr:type II toxin-antitoxin system HicA family toxin [Paludibacter sp.]MDD4426857.1 type II toxin-antitoxin system HicA family toxin [Paludibacter sp.]